MHETDVSTQEVLLLFRNLIGLAISGSLHCAYNIVISIHISQFTFEKILSILSLLIYFECCLRGTLIFHRPKLKKHYFYRHADKEKCPVKTEI